MEAIQVDTTPVNVTQVGAAMNQMFSDGSVINQNVVGQQPVQPQAAPIEGANQPTQPPNELDYTAYQQMIGMGSPQPQQPAAPEQPVQPVEVQAPRPTNASIPLSRFQEVVQQRNAASARTQALEAQLAKAEGYILAVSQQQQQAQPQQQAQVPDHITDPNGWAAYVQNQARAEAAAIAREQQAEFNKVIQAQANQQRMIAVKSSEANARAAYGPQADKLIAQATHAAVNAGLKDQFMQSADPVGEAIRWYQSNQVRQTYGSDPTTVKQRVAAELMNDPAFRAQFAGRPQPAVIPPPPGMMPRSGMAAPNGSVPAYGGHSVAAMLASRR